MPLLPPPSSLSIHFIWFRLKGRLFKASHLEQRGVLRASDAATLVIWFRHPRPPTHTSSSFSGHDDDRQL
jgi:hypothetical protein